MWLGIKLTASYMDLITAKFQRTEKKMMCSRKELLILKNTSRNN